MNGDFTTIVAEAAWAHGVTVASVMDRYDPAGTKARHAVWRILRDQSEQVTVTRPVWTLRTIADRWPGLHKSAISHALNRKGK